MRTFLRVFPSATLWAGGTLLIGSTGPLEISRDAIERKLTDVHLRPELSSIGVTDVDSVLRLYTAGPAEMRRFVGDGPVLTDDRPLLEYHRSLPAGEHPLDLSALRGDVREVLRR
jgi:spermidine synthase